MSSADILCGNLLKLKSFASLNLVLIFDLSKLPIDTPLLPPWGTFTPI